MLNDRTTTTSLIEIRDFLNSRQCAPVPWCPPRSAVDALYDLLLDHRGEDSFWADLKDLARRLDDQRFDPRALPGSDVLGDASSAVMSFTLKPVGNPASVSRVFAFFVS